MDIVRGESVDFTVGMMTALEWRHSITMGEHWTFLGNKESLLLLSPQTPIDSRKTRHEKRTLACLLPHKGSNIIMICMDKGDYLSHTYTHTSLNFRSCHHKPQLWAGIVKKSFQFLIWYCLSQWAWTNGLFLCLSVFICQLEMLSILHAIKSVLWGQHASNKRDVNILRRKIPLAAPSTWCQISSILWNNLHLASLFSSPFPSLQKKPQVTSPAYLPGHPKSSRMVESVRRQE